jgi:hypothetical protein
MPELEAAPPRPPSALLARTLRSYRLNVFATLFVPAFFAVVFTAGNLYQQSQRLKPWAWSNLWWCVAIDLVLAPLLWLYLRTCFAVIKRAYRDGILIPAKVESDRGGHFVGIKAVFVVGNDTYGMSVGSANSRLTDGDTCSILLVPSTRETLVVLADVGRLVTNVNGGQLAELVTLPK